MFRRNDNSESNSIIGEGSYFKGEFQLLGTLKVDGCYEGDSLEVDSLIIGSTGRVKSNIKASSVVVEGIVIGNIEASNRVMLMPTSRVLGEIRTQELIIQNGVVLEGVCIVSPTPTNNPKDTILSLYEKASRENNINFNTSESSN